MRAIRIKNKSTIHGKIHQKKKGHVLANPPLLHRLIQKPAKRDGKKGNIGGRFKVENWGWLGWGGKWKDLFVHFKSDRCPWTGVREKRRSVTTGIQVGGGNRGGVHASIGGHGKRQESSVVRSEKYVLGYGGVDRHR